MVEKAFETYRPEMDPQIIGHLNPSFAAQALLPVRVLQSSSDR